MYQGKYTRKAGRRCLKWDKYFVLLLSAAVLLCGVVGGSVAYLAAADTPLENAFTSAEVIVTVLDAGSNGAKLRNDGNTDAYVRAMVVATWQNSAGEVHWSAPAEGVDYTIDWNSADWDGPAAGAFFRTYSEKVSPGGSTAVLFTNCAPVEGKAPDGYHLAVDVIAEAVQADANGQAAWKRG